MAGCCQSGVISLWGLCTCGLHLVLTTKLTTNAASAVSVVPRETLEKSAFGGILVPAIYSVHRVQIPPSAPVKRDILSDVSFCFTRLILPFPRKPPVDKPRRTVYTYCHQKGSDEEEAVFPRPKRGAPPAERTPPRTWPVPLPSRLRRAGRVSPVTAIESDGVCRISSADTALQKLEIQTVFLRSCALSRRKISRHPQRTVKMLRRP